MPPFDQPLPEASALPFSRSRRLPPYRGIVAVDAKDFTGYPAIEHGMISQAVPQVLQWSFERAGLAEVWEGRRFPASTGDGYVFGFDPAWMPFLIHPWLHTLQETLTEFNVHSVGTVRIRLRVSLHIGPLPDTGGEFDGNGTPRNDTHRLLDSRPVKAMLAASNESITQVAAILSDRCYQDAVAAVSPGGTPTTSSRCRHRRGQEVRPAGVAVRARSSGNLYDRRILGDAVVGEHERAQAEAAEPAAGQVDGGSAGSYRADGGNLNTGTVHGGQSVTTVEGGQHVTKVRGDSFGGDYVAGHKAGTVHGNLGDTIHGDKKGRRR